MLTRHLLPQAPESSLQAGCFLSNNVGVQRLSALFAGTCSVQAQSRGRGLCQQATLSALQHWCQHGLTCALRAQHTRRRQRWHCR